MSNRDEVFPALSSGSTGVPDCESLGSEEGTVESFLAGFVGDRFGLEDDDGVARNRTF